MEVQSEETAAVVRTPSIQGSSFGFPIQADQSYPFAFGELVPNLSWKDKTLLFPSAGHLKSLCRLNTFKCHLEVEFAAHPRLRLSNAIFYPLS